MKVKKIIKYILIIIGLSLIILAFLYIRKYYFNNEIRFKFKGKKEITVILNEEYKEPGYVVTYNRKDISNKVKVQGEVDTTKVGKYELTYVVNHKSKEEKNTRYINVIETTKPEIILNEISEGVSYIVGNEYSEVGYRATDNYDGDITDQVQVENNVDMNTIGEYEIKYSVKDSSGNIDEKVRNIKVVDKPTSESMKKKIAVLNYHFFYDPEQGESCGDGNCMPVKRFREQLDYLKENNFTTLSMQEFRDWMYGVIEIPDKSVLITIDDGQMGTGKQNGNKLIPILEEYKMHATLFLITGWNDSWNYASDYLDLESHTHNMHDGGACDAPRGARMLCSSDDYVMKDLAASINVTGSKKAFCFPFYVYNDTAISQVKRAGFELAFIGGGYKVSRQSDKYHIPRYQILKSTSLDSFKSYVN